jgi:hypothetical protein
MPNDGVPLRLDLSKAIPIPRKVTASAPIPAPQISELQPSADLNFDMSNAVPMPKMPTKAGAIEYSPAFRTKLRDAVNAAQLRGTAESSFWVGASGGFSPIETQQGREVPINYAPSALLLVHTHPTNKGANEHPSDNDIKQAQKTGKPLITASPQGVYETDPFTGKTQEIMSGADWMNPTKPLKEMDEQ